MDIVHYINDLLLVNPCVCIPGLGSFIAKHNPAEIQFGFGYANPPAIKLEFNPDLKEDDELLVKYIASVEKIDKTEADNLVKAFVTSVKNKLNEGKNFYIEELGYFYAAAGRVDFKSAIGENLNLESFGLGKIKLPKAQNEIKSEPVSIPKTSTNIVSDTPKPIEKPTPVVTPKITTEVTPKPKTEPKPTPVKEVKKEMPVKATVESGGSSKWVLVGILVPIFIALIIFFAWYEDLYTIFDNKPVVETKIVKEKDTSNIIEKQIDEQTDKKNALSYNDTVTKKPVVSIKEEIQTKKEETVSSKEDDKYARFKNFYIIAGSFKSLDNAKKMQNKLSKEGFPETDVLPNGDMYRVVLQKYSKRQKALDEMAKLLEKGMNVWILSL